jgi:hypothetical protein
LVYADGVNILGGSIQTRRKNTASLVIASKETLSIWSCLEIRVQDRMEKIQIGHKSFETMKPIKIPFMSKSIAD